MDPPKTTAQWRLLILGDQTSDVSSLLDNLLVEVPSSAPQTEFVRNASAALRSRAKSLRPCQLDHIPEFRTLHDLAHLYQANGGRCHPAVNSAVLCVAQVLQFFRYFESHRIWPKASQHTTVLGLCTGSIVAAAFAASSSFDDFKLLAVSAVSIAFQLGLHVATVGSLIHQQWRQKLESWSVAIPNITKDEASKALETHSRTRLSQQHQCYLSAVGLKSVTISGAPDALRSFVDCVKASDEPFDKCIWLPIYAPYHSAELHPSFDLNEFLSQTGMDSSFLSTFKATHELLSAQTGSRVVASTALDLFEAAIRDCLQAPLRVDLIADELVSLVRNAAVSVVSLGLVGPVAVADSLAAALRSRTAAVVSSKDLFTTGVKDETRSYTSRSFNNEPLAIVGLSGRFPDADSAEALWTVLSEGRDTHRTIPPDRFDVETHVDPSGKAKNTSWTPYGCFINRPGEFDPKFFNMSPKEALQTDPMQRLALVTAYEALEQAGFVPDRTRSSSLDRVGTFYGQTSDDYRDVNSAQDIGTYFITEGIRAFGPGRINYFFKFSGPSYSVDTACSSSLAAIQLACTAIWNGECDVAVAGGLSVLTSPDLFSGLSRGQFLSKTGSCKTFDDTADGYCRADGIGTIVLKRLSDATLDRDRVLVTILGAGTNHSAQAISITHPHAETQSRLYRQVLRQAGVSAHDVQYIELHGTGTQAGDGTEMRSVTDVFAQPGRAKDNPLYVGAIKANIGHGEASSGVVSLIKAIMVLQKCKIPPHVGIKDKINRGFPDLQALNVRIASRMTPYPAGPKPKTILVNNFSAAGGNTALLIQEPPPIEVQPNTEPRLVHPVTVSGHTHSVLLNNLDKLIAFLDRNPDTSPLDLSYTTTARRVHHAYRATVVGPSIAVIRDELKHKRESMADGHRPKGGDSVVFTFTGQGAAYAAMAREIYSTSTQFRADLCLFDQIARQQDFPSFLPLIDGGVTDLGLLSPVQTQIGHVCLQIALARLWSSFGIKPAACCGHSLGEYAALHFSGVLSISDTIFLVGSRARLLENKCEAYSHAMLAVAASESVVESVSPGITAGVDLACYNTPQETVYAGSKDALAEMARKLSAHKVRNIQLRVPYAYHSAQVQPVLEEFEEIAEGVKIGDAHTTIISSTMGRVLSAEDKIDAAYLSRHCRQAVHFKQAIKHAKESGVIKDSTTLIEIGPHPICSGMVRRTLGEETQSLHTLKRQENPWTSIVGSLVSLHDAGFKINWSEYYRDFETSCRLIHLPAYAFDNKNYWLAYRNDWTLRKGDPPASCSPTQAVGQKSPLISSSVHRVLEEDIQGKGLIVFESDLSHPELHTAISGHRVNGASLCPSSLYADIALSIAQYIQQAPDSGIRQTGYDVCDMGVHQPLLVASNPESEQKVLRITARLDRQSQSVSLEYGTATTKHATCCVLFGDPTTWLKRWSHDLHFIDDRIASLHRASDSGKASNITTRLAYRLFANLVDYSTHYQRMKQVVLDSEGLEATASVVLHDLGSSGFAFSPYNLDGFLHLSGLILNGNETFDHREAVYISHGWESFRLAKPLRSDGCYKVYVKMIAASKGMMAGNLYVICDGEIVSVCEGIRFQRVPRAVLDLLLPPVAGDANKSVLTHAKKSIPKVEQQPKKSASRPQSHRVVERPKSRPTFQDSSPPAATANRPSKYLEIVASEIGLDVADISPADGLAELGVDSLMSLALAGRFASECGVDVDHGTVMQCCTVAELLAMVSGGGDSNSTSHPPTPPLEEHLSGSSDDEAVTTPTGASTPVEAPGCETYDLIHTIIVEETGIEPGDLDSSTELARLGVDSLMSLAILSKLRDQGVNLPSTFFLDYETLDQVQKAVSTGASAIPSEPTRQQQQVDAPSAQASPPPPHIDATRNFAARSILLQKRKIASSNQTLFLFPDGSGSPYAYAALSDLNPSFDVYGLVCPFLDTPESYTCSLEELARIYLRTIRSLKPCGPYHLGGWSAGGVLAFEAARQLGHQDVAGLILIDAPCPLVLPPMNRDLIEFLDSKGLFESSEKKRSSRSDLSHRARAKQSKVLRHFDATVRALGEYSPHPSPLRASTLLVWAREGVLEKEDDSRDTGFLDDPTAAWILAKRGEPAPNGWEKLLPRAEMAVVSVPGNHFSMMTSSNVIKIYEHMIAYLAKFA